MLSNLTSSIRPVLLSGAMSGALSAVLLALPAQAAVVLDTFGPGDTANGQNWALFNPDPSGGGQSLAVPFSLVETSTISNILTSIDGTGNYDLGIVAGSGLPTGAFVFSTVLTDPSANVSVSGLGWTLAAGDYWLVSKAQAGAFGAWRGGTQPGTTPWAFTFDAVDTDWVLTGTSDAPGATSPSARSPNPAPGR